MNIDNFPKTILKIFCIECFLLIAYLLFFFILLTPSAISHTNLGPAGDSLGLFFVFGLMILFGVISMSFIPTCIVLLIYIATKGIGVAWIEFTSIFTNYKDTAKELLNYYYRIYLCCGIFVFLIAITLLYTFSFHISLLTSLLLGLVDFLGSLLCIPIIILSLMAALIYIISAGLNQSFSDFKNFLKKEKTNIIVLKIFAFIFSTSAVIYLSHTLSDLLK